MRLIPQENLGCIPGIKDVQIVPELIAFPKARKGMRVLLGEISHMVVEKEYISKENSKYKGRLWLHQGPG